jgi:dTDP-4-dehydrorhamnose 3,5-epimerase
MEIPFLIEHKTFGDHRGNFCGSPIDMPKDKRLDKKWVQVNTSISIDTFTLRGLHFQLEPFQQSKYLKVIYGKIINFVLCVDQTRPDYGTVYSFEIDKDHAVMVPRGFANGLLTLEPNTVIQYFVDNNYKPEYERSILYSSVPQIDVLVNKYINDPIISDKDLKGIIWEGFQKKNLTSY